MIRDERSNALLNDDAISLNKYKLERERIRRFEQLAKEVMDIKMVLHSVCEKLDRIERS